MWRTLTVASDDRQKKKIISYHEYVKSMRLTPADLYKNDQATEAWIKIQEGLEVRANNSFQLTDLDDTGRPNSSKWQSIPSNFKH